MQGGRSPGTRRILLAFGAGILLGILVYLCVVTRPASRAVNGAAYFPVARDLLRSARSSVRLLMFELFEARPGDPLDSLYRLLEQAARRGVTVRVLTEGGEAHLKGRVGPRNRQTLSRLQQAGVQVRIDQPGQTAHAKLLLVDDRWLLVGSTNWTYYALTHNLETNVLLRGGLAVHQQAAFFDSLWRLARPLEGLPPLADTSQARAPEAPPPAPTSRTQGSPAGSSVGAKAPLSPSTSLIQEILAHPEAYHQRNLVLEGRVRNLRQKFSRRGNPYTLFHLDDGQAWLKVYLRGHPPLEEGQWVRVEGTFYAVKQVGRLRFYNELTAKRVEPVEAP